MIHEDLARIHIAELLAEAEAERLARRVAEARSTGITRPTTMRSARLGAIVIVAVVATIRLVAPA